MNTTEWIAIISSGISILISATALVLSCRSNRINLNAELLREAYNKILLIDIPTGYKKIELMGDKIRGVNDLLDAISDIRRRSLYFKKIDSKYYDELKKECQATEDLLNEIDKKYSMEAVKDFYDKLDRHLELIYEMIGKKYLGK